MAELSGGGKGRSIPLIFASCLTHSASAVLVVLSLLALSAAIQFPAAVSLALLLELFLAALSSVCVCALVLVAELKMQFAPRLARLAPSISSLPVRTTRGKLFARPSGVMTSSSEVWPLVRLGHQTQFSSLLAVDQASTRIPCVTPATPFFISSLFARHPALA